MNTSGADSGPELDTTRFQIQREQSGPFQLSWLSVFRAGPEDNGVYVCIAENRAGLRVANTTLTVVQALPMTQGLSRTHKVAIILASFLILVVLAMVLCFFVARQRALVASRSKFPGMIKQLARKADLVEVTTPCGTKAAQLAALQRSPQDEQGPGSEQTAPDLVSGKGAGDQLYVRPDVYGPMGNGYANPADPCYGQYGLCEPGAAYAPEAAGPCHPPGRDLAMRRAGSCKCALLPQQQQPRRRQVHGEGHPESGAPARSLHLRIGPSLCVRL